MISAFFTIGVTFWAQTGPLPYVGSLSTGLDSPARLAVTDAGLLVTDLRAGLIARFDAAGQLLESWSEPAGPVGIAVHADGRIFVSRLADRKVAIYNSSFVFQRFLGEPGVTFVEPTDMAFDPVTGRIYVVDSGADRIYGFDSAGGLVLMLGQRGSRFGEFKWPSAIAVDSAHGRILVADQDNSRVQVFNRSGVYQFSFGYRNRYLANGMQEGWFARTAGLAVDVAGNIYVTDAAMSTLRVFSPSGSELALAAGYGTAPGDLQTPSDVAIDRAGQVLVASSNAGSVEIYYPALAVGVAANSSFTSLFPAPASTQTRLGPVATASATVPGYDPPHLRDDGLCARCHDINGMPGGHEATTAGQINLCLSCHNTGGQAMAVAFRTFDAADPYGTNPAAADGSGTSHAWAVAAVNASADSVGPAPTGQMVRYLQNGQIRCGTCHNQHNNSSGVPYLRVSNNGDAMCKECHAPRNRGPGQGRSHPVGFVYPAGSGEFPALAADAVPVLKADKVECTTCHAVHGASSGGANEGAGDGMLLRGPNDDSFCQTCHTGHVGHPVAGGWQPACRDCHDVHDSTNINLSLVAAAVRNRTLSQDKPVVFTARTGANSFDDGDPAANDGICQVCHTQTTYHKHDASGAAHNNGSDCITCHPHSTGFMPGPGQATSCIACHSSPQDNGDNLPVGGRPTVVNADGTGGHHLQGTVMTDADCAVCHEMTQHQQGQVRLWSNPTTPTTPLVVSGDPAQLVSFCASCHDAMSHPTIHTNRTAWDPACTECHKLHQPANTNLSLVASTVRNKTLAQDKPVVFSARTGPNSFDDGDPAANNGICQVCHTSTKYHLATGTGAAHYNGQDCTTCHPHNAAYTPVSGSCIACHSSPQNNGDNLPVGGRPKVVNADGTGGHHLQGTVMTDADCAVCHEMTQHQQGQVRLWSNPTTPTTPLVVSGDPAQLVSFCASCHDAMSHPTIHTNRTAWDPACTECHKLHQPANTNLSLVASTVRNKTLAQDKPVVFSARTGANSFDDGDPAANNGICQVCHTSTKYHLATGTGAAHYNGQDCTTCHPHNAAYTPVSGSCIACHSSPQNNGDNLPVGGRPKVVNADGTGGHHLQGTVMTDADCAVCHEMTQHQQGQVRLWSNPTTPTTPLVVTGDPAQLVSFCASCHDAMSHPTIHTNRTAWDPACTECHKLHQPASVNLSLVASTVRNKTLAQDKPVIFTARTGANSFDDGNPTANNGICQVCHTQTAYHRQDGTGTAHNNGTDCTGCHPHQAGFQAAASTCLDCHQSPQGTRRAVVGEFALASHHVRSATVDPADCEVCHEMSQHRQGQVRLKNADTPTNAATVITLTASPTVNSAEAAKLETFCLACHDSNAAAGVAPFTDGVMPVVINRTLWTSASHRVAGMSCYGNGETFGCHSTGHGSAKRMLLAPADASQPPVTGDARREEEGMCYSCHDANGPASTNVQATFALASHHNVSSTEQTSGARVECKNCHNPHIASSTSLLINPNTGAAWTGTGVAFCLTCHDGTPPAGVSFPAAVTGTGYNKSAYTGTTHATTLGPDSCRFCHESHGAAYASLLRNRYVTTDNNSSTAGDGDYAACWACHSESATVSSSNAFGSRHSMHVRSERAPCIICHDTHAPADPGEPGLMRFAVRSGYSISYPSGRNASTAFSNTSATTGTCYITCHGSGHSDSYSRVNVSTVNCLLCHATQP